MPYKYAVIWFSKSHSWSGKVRPTYSESKMFRKLENAIKFSKEWSPPALIYKLFVKDGINEKGDERK